MSVNLFVWARKWGIPEAAVNDLRLQMGIDPSQPNPDPHLNLQTETGLQAAYRLQFARTGGLLWRNNVGAMQDENGRVIRYGLANESKEINRKVKSSDLIGMHPVLITPEMVGSTIGQFVAIETKKPGWKYTGTEREVAQKKFIELVLSRGGWGQFVNSLDGSVTGK